MSGAAAAPNRTFRHGRRVGFALPWLVLAVVSASGCQNNPFAAGGGAKGPGGGWLGSGGLFQNMGGAAPSADATTAPMITQLNELKAQRSQLDRFNNELTSQLADARKSVSHLTDRLGMLQEQLNQTAIQLREAQVAKLESEKKAQMLQASARSRAGASISANQSQRQTLRPVEIPGAEVRQDQDVIRVALPSDQIFNPGTDQLQASSRLLLDDVARALQRAYPRQRIGIEAFSDASLAGTASSVHQLTAAQALAIFRELTERHQFPAQQLMLVAHGASFAAGGGTFGDRARSRRVELVIYPETY